MSSSKSEQTVPTWLVSVEDIVSALDTQYPTIGSFVAVVPHSMVTLHSSLLVTLDEEDPVGNHGKHEFTVAHKGSIDSGLLEKICHMALEDVFLSWKTNQPRTIIVKPPVLTFSTEKKEIHVFLESAYTSLDWRAEDLEEKGIDIEAFVRL